MPSMRTAVAWLTLMSFESSVWMVTAVRLSEWHVNVPAAGRLADAWADGASYVQTRWRTVSVYVRICLIDCSICHLNYLVYFGGELAITGYHGPYLKVRAREPTNLYIY